MINTLQPSSVDKEKKGDVLKRIAEQYGAPEQKQREAVKRLGKDEFFQIMVQQIQHQDPLKPYQNEEMAAQMAQFTALEQMTNMNKNLEKMMAAQQPVHQLSAAGLIGKAVSVDSSRFLFEEGKVTDLTFNLPDNAEKAKIIILNEKGENVREIDSQKLEKGQAKIAWDGKKSNGLPAPSGAYFFQVGAYGQGDRPIPVSTVSSEIVHGVGFEKGETVLFTGDLRSPKKFLLNQVSRIVDIQNVNKKSDLNGPEVTSKEPIESINPAAKKFFLEQQGLVNPTATGEQSEGQSQAVDAPKPVQPVDGSLAGIGALTEVPKTMSQDPREQPGFGKKFASVEGMKFAPKKNLQAEQASQDGSVAGKWKE
ncbi:MAG: flagellar hook assembly protein FlgD [Bacteriovoracia bacterium]